MINRIAAFVLLAGLTATLAAQPTLTIDATKPAGSVSPLLYGLMTEEINYCYDGGLYAELVRNRAFLDDTKAPAHWSAVGSATIALDRAQPLNAAIPTSLRVEASSSSSGVANTGWWGVPVKGATQYRASFFAKADSALSGGLTISIQSEDGKTTYASARQGSLSAGWHHYELALTTTDAVTEPAKGRLVVTLNQPGTVWLGLVSLFPPTWNNRPNGLRPDLMQMLVDLKPKFLRFPGGNYLEGDTIETRFPWKNTLGPIAGRPGHAGPWGYRSSDGMGLLEFLEWTEDMGAEPVLAVYAGYSLKGAYVKPGPDLEPFVQEALDEIEYVSGPVSSRWGAERAKDGHPAPFKLRYVEIGNEDFFDKSGSYDGRFAQLFDAIKRRYPDLNCIASVGNEQPASKREHSRKADLLDEHYYRNLDTFLTDSPTHFDHYDRSGPKIFVGEWAVYETSYPPWNQRSKGDAPTPNMQAAIADAAWMAAMERNSDIVVMQCYAPTLVNVDGRQWRPDLIGYDATTAYGSPSYYAIKLFSNHVGDTILASTESVGSPVQATITRDSQSGEIFVKLVNPQATAVTLQVTLKGVGPLAGTAGVETLSAAPTDTNSLAQPTKVVPVKSVFTGVKSSFAFPLAPTSITVLTLKAQ